MCHFFQYSMVKEETSMKIRNIKNEDQKHTFCLLYATDDKNEKVIGFKVPITRSTTSKEQTNDVTNDNSKE